MEGERKRGEFKNLKESNRDKTRKVNHAKKGKEKEGGG